MAITTAFDGADGGYRLARKGLHSGTADSLAARELQLLWRRSHHLCRNNPAAVTAKNRLLAHWIGTGIKVKWDNPTTQKLWDEFVKNPSIDGHGTLLNIQALWAGTFFESGEVFTRMIFQKSEAKIPLKLQVIEPEQLDPLYSVLPDTRYGITFDAWGKPLKYNFFKKPQNDGNFADGIQRVPVPAEDVLHIFSRERPGQWRGIPRLTAAILAIYEMDELTDATLVKQKAAQAVGWIIKKRSSGSAPIVGNMDSLSNTIVPGAEEEESSTQIQKVVPGGVHYLEEDEDFEFAETTDIGNNFVTLLEHQWRLIASCLDVTYEQLTGDMSKVNFSSIRAGLIEFRRRVSMVQQLFFINLGMEPLLKRFKEYVAVYSTQAAATSSYKYVFPKQEWVDPLKDSQADLLEVRAGFATLQEKLAERGVEDIETHLQQLAKEQGYSIVLDSNPVHNTMDKTQVTDQQQQPEQQSPASSKQTTQGA